MSQADPQFPLVRRGYEPSAVDRAVAALRWELARNQEAVRRAERVPTEPGSFIHLGERVGQILALAEAEAAQLRDEARADAETEASRIVTDARRVADQERDAEESDWSARRQEAEAGYEHQRSRAAAAAADYETAREEAHLILREAEERASALVVEARTAADRIRTESDREFDVAARRLDGINQQLANVRQLLASLTDPSAAPDRDAGPAPEMGREPERTETGPTT